MERLTEYVGKYAHGRPGKTYAEAITSTDICRGEFEATACVERLAAYEDTGLTPEEIPRWVPVGERLPVESEYRDKSTGELVPLLVCVKGTEYPFRAMYDGNRGEMAGQESQSPTGWRSQKRQRRKTMLNIDEIRAVTDKATSGPWENKTNAHPQCNGEPWGWIGGAGGNICWGGYRGQVNGDFIASARQWVPALCDEVERLRKETAVLHRALEMACERMGNLDWCLIPCEGISCTKSCKKCLKKYFIEHAREEMEK